MKTYGIIMSLLAVLGLGWLLYQNNQSLDEGLAGRAFTVNDDGELVEADGTRANVRTTIDVMDSPDGIDEPILKKFELIERSGKSISSDDLEGQPYVAGFFFSTCPSICVRQNSKVQDLQNRFRGQPVRFLSISCDPEIDQPEVLAEYAKRFEADADQWYFLTGRMKYIRRVGAEIFRLGVVRRGHPEKFALMDAEGNLHGLYTWSDDDQWQALETDIAKLIEAGGVAEPSEQAPGNAELDTVEPHGKEDV